MCLRIDYLSSISPADCVVTMVLLLLLLSSAASELSVDGGPSLTSRDAPPYDIWRGAPPPRAFTDVVRESVCEAGTFLWGYSPQTRVRKWSGTAYGNLTTSSSYGLLSASSDESHRDTPNVHVFYENPDAGPFLPLGGREVGANTVLRMDGSAVWDWYTQLLTLLSLYKDVSVVPALAPCPGGHSLWVWNGEGTIAPAGDPSGWSTLHGKRTFDDPLSRAVCFDYTVDVFKGGAHRPLPWGVMAYDVDDAYYKRYPEKSLCFQTRRRDKAVFYFMERPMTAHNFERRHTEGYHYDRSLFSETCFRDQGDSGIKCSEHLYRLFVDSARGDVDTADLAAIRGDPDYVCSFKPKRFRSAFPCSSSVAFKRACDDFPGCTFIPLRDDGRGTSGCHPGPAATTTKQHTSFLQSLTRPCTCTRQGTATALPAGGGGGALSPADMVNAETYLCGPFAYALPCPSSTSFTYYPLPLAMTSNMNNGCPAPPASDSGRASAVKEEVVSVSKETVSAHFGRLFAPADVSWLVESAVVDHYDSAVAVRKKYFINNKGRRVRGFGEDLNATMGARARVAAGRAAMWALVCNASSAVLRARMEESVRAALTGPHCLFSTTTATTSAAPTTTTDDDDWAATSPIYVGVIAAGGASTVAVLVAVCLLCSRMLRQSK